MIDKDTPLVLVEKYHAKYIEYETAFNNDPNNKEGTEDQLRKLISSTEDEESEEFINSMIDIVVERPQKKSDVNNAAFKFLMYADFYTLTQKEPLPENILKDYNSLPIKESLKTYYSVESGKFVKNEELEITSDMREYFKALVLQLKKE